MKIKILSLRPLKLKDAPRMLEWLHDESIMKYFQFDGSSATLQTASEFIQKAIDETRNLHRAIVDENDTYLGTVSLKQIDEVEKKAEYAICMLPEAIGTGAAKKGTELILRYGFEVLELNKIYLNVLNDNERAVRFYEKLGFIYTGSTTIDFKGREKELRWYDAIMPN